MGDVDFVTQFYNIEGDLISDRKRNFSRLLKSKTTLTEEELKNLCPRTYLESLFYVDTLIYFKKTIKLLEILKEGNEIFISKILKQPWFFKEIFGDTSAEELVNEFLPCTSYTIRMKILRKIAIILNETQMDEIFDCVLERYGFHIARNILHTCSRNKIETLLKNHEVLLQPKQVKLIFDRHPELFVLYLEHYNQVKRKIYYNKNVYKYVARKNIKFWLQLKETGTLQTCNLGRRISKKVVDLVKSDVIENVEAYANFLKKDVIVRKLDGDFKNVYLQLFPKKKTTMYMSNFCNELLHYYPKKRQWDLLSQTFTIVFNNEDVLDNLLYLHMSFLKLFPNRDIIHKWAEVHYKHENDLFLFKYLHPNKAIPMIKERINVTSNINMRTNLVILLLENCDENDDLEALEAVLKYICFRHRNEGSMFHDTALTRTNSLFQLNKFNENHWKYVNCMIIFLKLKNRFDNSRHFIFLKRYLEYLFLNGKSFKKEFEQYINKVIVEELPFSLNLNNPLFEKEIFTRIINFLPDILKKTKVSFNKQYTRLIIDIINFNKCYPEHFIDMQNFPNLTSFVYSTIKKFDNLNDEEQEMIDEILLCNMQFPGKSIILEPSKILEIFVKTKDNFRLERTLERMVKKRNRSEFENAVFNLFWKNLFYDSNMCSDIVSWCFRNEPRTLLPYIDIIFERSLTSHLKYFKPADIKLMSHFKFDTKLIECYAKELDDIDCSMRVEVIEGESETIRTADLSVAVFTHMDKEYYYVKEKVIRVLGIIMPTDDFNETVAKRFLPSKDKLDLLDAWTTKIFKLQCKVAKCLKTTQEPVKLLPIVIKFSLGDYLQSALPSLYSIFYRSAEEKLYPYIDILSKRDVSMRQYAVVFSCKLLNFSYALNMLKTVNRNNIPSAKHLFSTTLEYFSKNPTEDLLNVVFSKFSSIDRNDDETFRSLVEVTVPEKYKICYFEKCWIFFENMKKKGVKIRHYLNQLLHFIDPMDILVLPREFCIHIITHYFKECNEKLYEINTFVFNFLRYRKSEQEENFKFVFEIISVFKGNNNMKRKIKYFFNKCYESTKRNVFDDKKDVDNNEFIKEFLQSWTTLFTPSEMFDEYMLLRLLSATCESPDPFVENYARSVLAFLDELISEFGPHLCNKFKNILDQTLVFKEKDKYLFFYAILKIKVTPLNCILVLELMRPCNDEHGSTEIQPIFTKILEILKSVNDPIVILYYNAYLNY